MFCVQVLKHLDLLYTLQCYFISVLFTADIISTVEFNYSGDLLATGDKGGRVVIFQREQEVSDLKNKSAVTILFLCCTVSLHLFMLWGLNGWIVFSENPKLAKFLISALCWTWQVSWVVVPLPPLKKRKSPQNSVSSSYAYLVCSVAVCRIAFALSPKLSTWSGWSKTNYNACKDNVSKVYKKRIHVKL